ncbi:HTH domain-containing protein [Salinirubellus sp. GCM10025818]|uniref:HTH domain-containing protein n=1 Tax=Salinirubellus TaxID=2162630 RepID=UPI0030CCD530
MSPSRPPVTVECYARTAPQGTSIEDTLDTLREYRDRGVIEDVSFEVWPDEVALEGYAEETPIVDRYRRFRSWAEGVDVSLRPAFTVRERGSLIDDRTDAALVLPERCLAVRVDGELATVAPHRADGTTYTAEDALADIERSDPEFRVRASVADSVTEPTTTAASTAGRSE